MKILKETVLSSDVLGILKIEKNLTLDNKMKLCKEMLLNKHAEVATNRLCRSVLGTTLIAL